MEIKLENLTKIFPARKKGQKEVVAVDDFNDTIPDGMLVALLGPSGCGKSTTLNLICGLLKPTSGKIYFGDRDVTNVPPEYRGVGMVFQNYALYPHMSVEQNIRFPLENLKGDQKLSKEQMKERVLASAKLVMIDSLLDRKPKELSGGQQQRVAIARALVKLPQVLLLDEPLSNLDARLRLQTREEIRRIQKETKITTIFVTHDQDEAMSISDMIVVMKDGKVQQIGKPQDVYDHPINLFVAKFLGTPPINVFEGAIFENGLWIGEEKLFDLMPTEDRPVFVAIRPEGFVLDEHGPFSLDLIRPEVLGRDISIVAKHKKAQSETIRAIIDAFEAKHLPKDIVRFYLKPHKVHVFDAISQERIEYVIREDGE
ncbi:ABC transporter ATP-binding protein [Dubosiella newyorkensis]|uniref:ABC transporter ATP-binding protein n=1 Tax=Dubosiella newyorkensis TaxID=1862672 RepID=UPI00272C3DD9|nr:ABC transporter ATP-binding protein [Dubosiella newyorkensis]